MKIRMSVYQAFRHHLITDADIPRYKRKFGKKWQTSMDDFEVKDESKLVSE